MDHQLSRKRAGAMQCAMLCALCAFVSFVPFLFRDGGFFHVWADFNIQQIPFGMALHNALSEFNPGGWTWSYDLGMSTIQAFSFYALGSPFYWLTLLFPADLYPFLLGWIYILKYTAAGVTAYYYLRRFTKGETAAVAGALMYAFSGFQAANLMYFHFHDAVALFPLLLIGLEKILENPKDRGLFIFAVFLSALNNYYFFVMETVFLGLYFLFRSFCREERDLKKTGKDFLNCLLCGLWGAAMAAVLLLPSLLYILQSSRAERAVSLSDIFWDFRWLAFTLKGLLLPGDTMAWQSAFYEDQYGSVAAWLPMAGPALALAFCLKPRRKSRSWLSRMIPLLLLMSLSPLLASVFDLVREVTYRWWFMGTLLLALASAVVLENNREYPVKKGLLLSGGMVLAFCAGIFVLHLLRPEAEILGNPGRFLLFGLIALCGVLLLLLLRHFRKMNSPAAVGLICLFCAGTTFLTLSCYRSYGGFELERMNLERGMQLEVNDPQYRYKTENNLIMLPAGGSGLTVFSSTLSKSEQEFDLLFDFGARNHTLNKNEVRGLPELFAGKYIFSGTAREGATFQALQENDGPLYVVGRDACPIGFAVDHYLLRDQLLTIDEENRGAALLYAAVIDPESEEAVAGLCTNLPPEEIPLEDDLTAIVAKNTENRVLDFERDTHGFRCRTDYPEPRAVYFSVPADAGWTAAIDNEKQEILPSGGMMLLIVPEGSHEIEFTYVTPGYTIGKWISLGAIAAFILRQLSSAVRTRTGRRRRAAGSPPERRHP